MKRHSRLSLLFLVVILGNLGFRVYSYRGNYQLSFDPEYWKGRYLRSQWVDPESADPIGDDGLYAYVGWEYLHGRNPTTLNAQMPPLGKYLIGLSEVVFHNQNIFGLISGLAVLIVFYQVSFLLFSNRFWALLSIAVFSFQPLFFTQLKAPFLDNLYLFFLLLTVYFFLKDRFFLSSFFLGLFSATKSPFLSLFVLISLFLTTWLTKGKKRLKRWLLSLPLVFLSYLSVYFRLFQLGGGLREFFKVQKWMINFYLSGSPAPLGGVLTLVLFNRQPLWWSAQIKEASSFNLSWPFFFIFHLFCFMFCLFRVLKNKKFGVEPAGLILLLLWPVFYLFFLFFVPVYPRYLLLLLPFWILLFAFCLKENLGRKAGKKLAGGLFRIFSFLRKNALFFLILLATYIIRRHQFGNFFFGPKQGKDFLMIKEIVYFHRFLPTRRIVDLIFSYLSFFPFILTRGNPLATLFWLGFALDGFVLLSFLKLGQKLKQRRLFLLIYFVAIVFVNNLTLWRHGEFFTRTTRKPPSLLFKTELAVIDGVYENLKLDERDFNFYVLSDGFDNDHYVYLFSWYGWPKYGHLPIWSESGHANAVYLIFEDEKPGLVEELVEKEALDKKEELFHMEKVKIERWKRS